MKRIFSAGEGPDIVDLAAPQILVIEWAGLFEHPDVEGFFVSAKRLELLLSHPPGDSLKILSLQQEAAPGCIAAQTALLTAESFPEELHPLVGVLALIAGGQGQGDVERDLLTLIYAAKLLLLLQDGPVGTHLEEGLMTSLALLFHARG